jgi:hypothetical protein
MLKRISQDQTGKMKADILTKPMTYQKFQDCCDLLGLASRGDVKSLDCTTYASYDANQCSGAALMKPDGLWWQRTPHVASCATWR